MLTDHDFEIIRKYLSMAVMLNELSQDAFEKVNSALKESRNELFYSRRQAAEFFSCSTAYIDKLSRLGRLKKFFIGGKPLFKENDLLSCVKCEKGIISSEKHTLISDKRN